jgi:hypothetical protein
MNKKLYWPMATRKIFTFLESSLRNAKAVTKSDKRTKQFKITYRVADLNKLRA